MDMVNTEKRKEKQEVQLLNYQQIPLPCLRNNNNNNNNCEGKKKKKKKRPRENQKPKGKQKLGWPVHILDQRKPG